MCHMGHYENLVTRFLKIDKLNHAMTFLYWDQAVTMPPNGAKARQESLAELASIKHQTLTDAALEGEFQQAQSESLTAEQKTSLAEMHLQWSHAKCLPEDLVKQKVLAGATCEQGWRTQKKENDWPNFLKNFKEVVNLSRQEATLRMEHSGGAFSTPYEALMDLYCHGDSQADVDAVFDTIKNTIPTLFKKVIEKQKSEKTDKPKMISIPTEVQKKINLELMKSLRFDFESGRLDASAHPFSTGDFGDQRITTRYQETMLLDTLLATAHETGHASYEAGLPESWHGLPVGKARNMCIHESQSLLFEKMIFTNQHFLDHFVPRAHAEHSALKQFSVDDIWHLLTRVQASFIRVEADEVSYPLHVLMRYEIERDLVNKKLEASDVPDAWHEKSMHYLGLPTEGNFKEGCMQDIHWTDGSFGYFPSYTLGAINAAQLWASLTSEHPGWEEKLTSGDVSFAKGWLSDKIWSKASTLSSSELMRGASNENTNPQFLIDHLTQRYL